MAFVAKVCASLAAGVQLVPRVLPQLARNFHLMVKPIPAPAIYSPPVATTADKCALPATSVIGLQKLLAPFKILTTHVAGFKVKGRLKRRCKDCYIVYRQNRGYDICPTHPRHKQMAMKKSEHNTWILTHATQSKVRPY